MALWARLAGLTATAVIVGSGVASAAVRYAEPAGNGPAASCPEADPCSLETAVENPAAVDGDEVIVLPGSYPLAAGVLNITQDLDVHGAPGAPAPLITGEGSSVVRMGTAASRLADVNILGSGNFALSQSNGLTERVTAVLSAVGAACSAHGGLLRDSVCAASAGGSGLQVGLFGPAGTYSISVRNVTAWAAPHTSSGGINVATGAGVTNNANFHNVIAEGATADVRAFATQPASQVNLVFTNSAYQTREQQGQTFVTAPGAGTNILEPPLLADPAAGDFHQLAGSPTIDRGAAEPLLGAFDLDRQARTDGGVPDIGADEFQVDPETRITKGPKKKLKTRAKKAAVKIKFTADEATSGFLCSLDGKTSSECSSPFRKKVKSGKHRFEVTAVDLAGNVDATPATHRWKVKRKRR